MFIFLGLWVILIHLISSVKKPTKSPSNSLQWICPLGIPKLPSETSQRCLRDGEIGSIGCLRKKGGDWELYDLNQCLTLSLYGMERSDSLLIVASYFWSNALNAFIFGHGLMTITLVDVYMLTDLRITRSMQPYEYLSAGSKKFAKISDYIGWASYILNHIGDGLVVSEREYVDF